MAVGIADIKRHPTKDWAGAKDILQDSLGQVTGNNAAFIVRNWVGVQMGLLILAITNGNASCGRLNRGTTFAQQSL